MIDLDNGELEAWVEAMRQRKPDISSMVAKLHCSIERQGIFIMRVMMDMMSRDIAEQEYQTEDEKSAALARYKILLEYFEGAKTVLLFGGPPAE